MKNHLILICFMGIFTFTSACSATENTATDTLQPPTSTTKPQSPTETLVPSSTLTSTPTITPTDVPPTSTPTITPFPPFRDDFSQLLEPGWTWVREEVLNWNLLEKPGFLHIVLDSHKSFEETENILLRHAPEGNFVITTRVLFTPYSNFQSAGLIVYQDDSNALFFRRAMCYIPNAPGICVGNGLYFDNYAKESGNPAAGYSVGSNFATKTINPSEALLRLTREGSVYTAFYSSDGENWITVGRHESDLFPFYVGLIASNAFEHPANADFDYFTLEILP